MAAELKRRPNENDSALVPVAPKKARNEVSLVDEESPGAVQEVVSSVTGDKCISNSSIVPGSSQDIQLGIEDNATFRTSGRSTFL